MGLNSNRMELVRIGYDQLPQLGLQLFIRSMRLAELLVQPVHLPGREQVRADQTGEEQEQKKTAERKSKSWHGGDREVLGGFILPSPVAPASQVTADLVQWLDQT